MNPKKLPEAFYLREDVRLIAKELLGKFLMTSHDGGIAGGMIVETEAYEGATDRASHAYLNRRTARTEVMFGRGGRAYVYLCYGIHSLFNVVTNVEDIPHAILVRGIIPTEGLEFMRQRTKKDPQLPGAGIGPGRVSLLLGIHYSQSGTLLTGDRIWIEDRKLSFTEAEIITGPRVGVGYAGPDALLPYRYRIKAGWPK